MYYSINYLKKNIYLFFFKIDFYVIYKMEKYVNLQGFENTHNGNQIKHSGYHITDLYVIFYKIPLLFIKYEIEEPININVNTHIFTEMDDFILFLKKYTCDETQIEYENLNDIFDYYININLYFEKHNLNIEDFMFDCCY